VSGFAFFLTYLFTFYLCISHFILALLLCLCGLLHILCDIYVCQCLCHGNMLHIWKSTITSCSKTFCWDFSYYIKLDWLFDTKVLKFLNGNVFTPPPSTFSTIGTRATSLKFLKQMVFKIEYDPCIKFPMKLDKIWKIFTCLILTSFVVKYTLSY
jgi:hypothetical protein